jgi:hypothetical protein
VTESENETPGVSPPRQPGLVRDVVSGLTILAGLAGAVLCLAHLGPWVTGLSVSFLVLCLGVAGAMRRDAGETEPARHVIEIRHTDEAGEG